MTCSNIKGTIVSIALAALCSTTWAIDKVGAEIPLITKTNANGGMIAPDYMKYEKCEVFKNHVVVTTRRGMNEGRSFETKNVVRQKTSKGIYDVIANAAQEELKRTPNFLCDGPYTEITANFKGDSVVLFSSGGCGSDRLSRDQVMSNHLKDVVNQFCTTTYDLGANSH